MINRIMQATNQMDADWLISGAIISGSVQFPLFLIYISMEVLSQFMKQFWYIDNYIWYIW